MRTKRVFWGVAMVACSMSAGAQVIELNEQGAYERKEVIEVDSVAAGVLYDRAMVALAEWTGPDGKATAGVDYKNQETHTVIYKGAYYLGFKKHMLSGFDRYANYTLKVRCKDGKAQVTLTVPTVTTVFVKNGQRRTYSLVDILDLQADSGKKRADRIDELMERLQWNADNIVAAMKERLKGAGEEEEDDF